jgi:heat shock protein HslJ
MFRRLIVLLAIAMVAVSAAACGSSTGDLTGKTWQWNAATTKAPASQSVVPNPADYTIMFNTDGSYNGKADCNQINGQYTTNGSSITIKPGATTMAFCGDASLDTMFIAGLGSATTWAVSSGNLTLTNAAGDTMTFAKGS